MGRFDDFRKAVFGALAGIATAFGSAEAQQLPGLDDPALMAAVADWLDSDTPLDATAEIGRIAASGNIAAQVLANGLHRNIGWFLPDVQVSRGERFDFFPPAAGDDRERRFTPYIVVPEDFPARIAFQDIQQADDMEEWRALFEVMLEGGLRERALLATQVGVTQSPFHVEVLQFAATQMTPADRFISDIWGWLVLYAGTADEAPELFDEAAWPQDPRQLLEHSGFFAALDAGLWPAVFVAAFSSHLEWQALEPFSERPDVAATLRLLELRDDRDPGEPAPADLETVGRVLFASAPDHPYLQPLANLCSAECGADPRPCMATGVINRFDQSISAGRLEPMIPIADYFASRRAVDELRATITAYDDANHDWYLQMPQCALAPAP